jgi:hypothetical protein
MGVIIDAWKIGLKVKLKRQKGWREWPRSVITEFDIEMRNCPLIYKHHCPKEKVTLNYI